MEITKAELKAGIKKSLNRLVSEGLPAEIVKKILESATPLGDLSVFEKELPYDDFQELFSKSRKSGIDGSCINAYGGSTVPAILGISPYVGPLDVYIDMLGLPKAVEDADDPGKEEIFYAGHQIEPVYRNYFRYLYGDRYIVFDCDIQFKSKLYPHFLLNIDGLLYDKETGQFGILEIKHTASYNIPTINAFETGNVPKHYDVQGRSYMEGLNADFCIFFLGYGNRPGDTVLARVERDEALGADILEACEDFITSNIEGKIAPSLLDVKDVALRRSAIEKLYGKIDYSEKPVKFPPSMAASMKALLLAKEEVDKAKAEAKVYDRKVKEKEERYEELQIPFIEAIKTAPSGYMEVDGRKHNIYYNTRSSVNVEKLQAEYPDLFDAVKKAPSIDTAKLKKLDMKAYSECYEPSLTAKRTFKLK